MSNTSEILDIGGAIQEDENRLDSLQQIAVLMLIVFSVIGVTGNALVLYGYSRLKPKKTSSIYILTLAGIDFTTCLVTIPATVAVEIVEFRMPYDFLCKAYHFLLQTTIPFSTFVMVAIAVDRYYCICRPFIQMQIMTKSRAKIIMFSLGILALFIGFVGCLNFGLVMFDDTGTYREELNITLVMQSTTDVFNGALQLKEKTNLAPEPLCGNPRILGDTFYRVYNTIYASIYATCGIVVIILYVVIYRFIRTRRQRLRTESSLSCTFSKMPFGESGRTDLICVSQKMQNTCVTEEINNDANLNCHMLRPNNEGSESKTPNNETKPKPRQKKKKNYRISNTTSTYRQHQERIRDDYIKTTLTLSFVAYIYIVAFLPAWLMKLEAVRFNLIVFYMYFTYNVANPFIYAFMNPDFRRKIAIVGTRIKNRCKK
ncbi:orexin receptor type 2-like [Saccostrea cucullata]|uniref:orexin receptor type 2-like n=1 Tax=Saccostrea cuccullata TaxID=36930 RepID=UPI002ED4F8C1